MAKKKITKNLVKVIGITVFALLMFTNIKIALMDDAGVKNGDTSVLGIELSLFEATYATTGEHAAACAALGCGYFGNGLCGGYYVGGQWHNCWWIEVNG